MGSLTPTIRIAMLNADTPVPNVLAKYKTYGFIFHNLLCGAAQRIAPQYQIDSTDFNVVLGEYPKSLSDYDAIVVSGSASSAYDDADWIHKLSEYLATAYYEHPQVKIFGSCFGHQVICHALSDKLGCTVEKCSHGWELGVHTVQLTDEFRKAFPAAADLPSLDGPAASPDAQSPSGAPKNLRFQFIHADHVKLPAGGLPSPWVLLGTTEICANQGVYEPGHVLTYQGHFEFDRFVNTETLKVFGALWKPEVLNAALESMDRDDDAPLAAEMVVRFFLDGRV